MRDFSFLYGVRTSFGTKLAGVLAGTGVLEAVYLALRQHGHETEYSTQLIPKVDRNLNCTFTIPYILNVLLLSSVNDQMVLCILGK
jgi:hypothetical protein